MTRARGRGIPLSLEERDRALRRLAGLIGVLPLRVALEAWPARVDQPLRAQLEVLARRLRLGQALAEAIVASLSGAFEEDALALATTVATVAPLGGDLAAATEALASSLERRARALSQARAAAAGARLSGRLVAGLPLLFVPALPLARAPLLDAAGVAMLGAGLVLVAAGLVCVERLAPRVDRADDAVALACDIVASVMLAGASLPVALEAVARHPPGGLAPALTRARRRAALGESWPAALAGAGDEGLRAVAEALVTANVLGMPHVEVLGRTASARREERTRSLELAARRSQVLMFIPVSLFVLPAFVLLALGPFVRAAM